MKLELATLAPIAFAIMPLVDVLKRVIEERFAVKLDYSGTLACVLVVSTVLALTHFYYPTWPMYLQVAAGGIIVGLDAAGIVKLALKKDGSPEA